MNFRWAVDRLQRTPGSLLWVGIVKDYDSCSAGPIDFHAKHVINVGLQHTKGQMAVIARYYFVDIGCFDQCNNVRRLGIKQNFQLDTIWRLLFRLPIYSFILCWISKLPRCDKQKICGFFNVFVDIHHYSEQINVSYVMLCYHATLWRWPNSLEIHKSGLSIEILNNFRALLSLWHNDGECSLGFSERRR